MKKIIIFAIFIFSSNSFSVENPVHKYFELKALCSYEEAIDILEEWTLKLNDPVKIEINLFRIFELVKYPELIDRAITALRRISENETITANRFLKARLDMLLSRLFLKKGHLDRALKIRDSLGFVSKYTISYSLNSIDNINSNPDLIIDESSLKWFEASIDPDGTIDIGELLEKTNNKSIYLKCPLFVNDDAEYILTIGKTGQTEIQLDEKKIFTDKSRHGFFPDQYFIKIFLSKGRHDILITTSSSSDGIKLALRLTDVQGNPVHIIDEKLQTQNKPQRTSSLKSSLYFNSLNNCLNHNNDPEAAFTTGYLFYITNLNNEETGEFGKYFPIAGNDRLMESASFHYLGLLENDVRLKNLYFKNSITAFSRNIESMQEIAELKLNHNYIYDAFKVIESIKKISPHSREFLKLKAMAIIKSGWHMEALKECEGMKRTGKKSCAYEIEQIVYSRENRYNEAFNACYNLFKMDRINFTILNNLIDYSIKAGRYNEADNILNQCTILFPNNIKLRLKHAELMEYTKSPGNALPYLLHARKVSPYHNKVLLKTGLIYHKLNNDEIAVQYMRTALQHDHNEWIKKYINFINNKKNIGKTEKTPYAIAEKLKPEKTLKHKDRKAEKISAELHPVKRWYISGPYIRYGPSDMDYAFLPEIINLKDIPGVKKLTLREPKAVLDLKQYNYPEKGITYAAAAIACKEPVKIRIYSQSSYKLFINGEETIKNIKTGVFRNLRIVKVQDTDSITLMIKLYMEEKKDAHLRIIITNEKDEIINPQYETISNEVREFTFTEEIDYQNLEKNLDFSETTAPIKNASNYLPARLDYADFLLNEGYEKEFEKEINSIKKKFPHSVETLKLAAEYYEQRNIIKAIETYKTILLQKQCNDSLKKLIGLYEKTGLYNEIITLGNIYDPGLFRKELIQALINSKNYSRARKTVFQGLLSKNDPYYNIKLGELAYIKDMDPLMYWEKALSISPSNFSLRDYKNYLETGSIENPFKEYETNIETDWQMKEDVNIQLKPVQIVSRKMIFLFHEDGGNRLFCEDIINFQNAENLNKWKKYKILFRGEVHPVRIMTYKNGITDDQHRIYKEKGQPVISLQSIDKGANAYIGYYIDNPIKPRGLNFFSIPYINIKDPDESLSQLIIKIIAPKEMKFEFLLNSDIEIHSETISDKIEYSIELKNISEASAVNEKQIFFTFSNMTEPRDFVMWYSGLIQNIYDFKAESFASRFGKSGTEGTVKSVYKFLSEEIKLTDNGLYSPQKPGDTLTNKKGSSEDKTILASILLKELGIKSYVAFTGDNTELSTSLISPDILNKILLYIPLDVDKGLWLDFSGMKNKFGTAGNNLAGKEALIIIKDGYEVKRIEIN